MVLFEYATALLLTLLSISSAKHLYILSTKASFSAKRNLTKAYKDFLIMEGLHIDENYALIKNTFSGIETYSTQYTLGHNPAMHFANYYFQIKNKDKVEKTLEHLKNRLSSFNGYHNFSWKISGDDLKAVYVKSERFAPNITAMEFNEIISALGGWK